MSFGHAGTIVRAREDSATRLPPEAAGIRLSQRIDQIPDRVKGGTRTMKRGSARHLHLRPG